VAVGVVVVVEVGVVVGVEVGVSCPFFRFDATASVVLLIKYCSIRTERNWGGQKRITFREAIRVTG
jgi:hypothetical protein